MVNNTMGQVALRTENVQRAVTGFALQQYRFKSITLVQKSNSWKESYFEEGSAELTAAGTRAIKGLGRGSDFPHLEPNWIEKSVRHQKYGGQGFVYWEDILTNAIDVMQRTLLRISRAIAKSVDDEIYAQWIGAVGINTADAVENWDHVTKSLRDPIEDILSAIQSIDENNYDAQVNGFLLLSPKDYKNLMTNSKIINNPSFKSADVVTNGRVGKIADLTIVKSNSVPADEALIVIGQIASTWKTAAPLKVVTIEEPLIKTTIRAAEIGITQVTNPKAIARITNTQRS